MLWAGAFEASRLVSQLQTNKACGDAEAQDHGGSIREAFELHEQRLCGAGECDIYIYEWCDNGECVYVSGVSMVSVIYECVGDGTHRGDEHRVSL